jgi:DNA-binding response OmpR family regulator
MPIPRVPLALLLHEHNEELRALFAWHLEAFGVNVVPFRELDEARRLARYLRPQAIIIDVLDPLHDGFATAARIGTTLAPHIFYTSILPRRDGYHCAIDRIMAENSPLAALRGALAALARGRRKTRILVADDDPAVVARVARACAAPRYECIRAYDGLEALERASQERPDIALIDIGMPVIDGREVIRNLAQNELTRAMSIIALYARRPARGARDIACVLTHSTAPKPRPSGRGQKAPLKVDPEQALAFRPERAEGLTKGAFHRTIDIRIACKKLYEVINGARKNTGR